MIDVSMADNYGVDGRRVNRKDFPVSEAQFF
jgi:hypothetical protein